MQKPQKPKKREDDLGSRRYDWKDWEKGHNYITGYSFNRMYDVYQQNELLRVRNDYNIQSMQEGIDKIQKTNRKQIETLKEDYKVMMAYGYVYKLHSIGQDPDNDELPLIRKRVKPPSAHQKPKDPDCQLLPNDILEYYDDRPSSFRLPSVAPKWRPMSFAGNPKTNGDVPQLNRPKSYVPEAEFSCITPENTRRFYDKEAKKALEKITPTNRRLHETQKILRNISNPLGSLIDSKKTTSAILKDYRKGQHDVKKDR